MNYFRQIDGIKQQATTQLDSWKKQQDYLIQNRLVQTYQSPISTDIPAPVSTTLNPQSISSGGLKNLRWNPNLNKFVDELGQVVG